MMTRSIKISISLSSLVFLLLLLPFILFAELCHPDDKAALLKLKESFNNAYIFHSWIRNTDCCQWGLVTCDSKTHRVNSLFITEDDSFLSHQDQLAGTIPEAIGDLPYLTFIYLHKLPRLTGTIPRSITKLKNLSMFWITWTNLTGPIPHFLDQLTSLNGLDLSFNNLTGPIPSSLSNLPNLNGLLLDRNHLTGSIPESFGNFKNNQGFMLRLTKNNLFGPLPKTLASINFSELRLARNNFTGDVSFLLGKDKDLQILDISRNRFSFNMTNLELPENMNFFDMNHNMIYGSLPPTITQLGTFNASYNRLCGQIPVGGGFDQYSFIHNKCLCGSPLPPC